MNDDSEARWQEVDDWIGYAAPGRIKFAWLMILKETEEADADFATAVAIGNDMANGLERLSDSVRKMTEGK